MNPARYTRCPRILPAQPRIVLLVTALLPPGLAPALHADEHTLASFAGIEDLCLPAAAPLPLDLFSRAGGTLGDLRVLPQGDDWKIDLPGETSLEITGFPALRIVLTADPVFSVEESAGCGSVTFSFTGISFEVALDPRLFFAGAGGALPRFTLRQGTDIEVVYESGDDAPVIHFRRTGGAGPVELELGGDFKIGETGVTVKAGAVLALPATLDPDALAGWRPDLANIELELGPPLSFLDAILRDRGVTFSAGFRKAGITGSFDYIASIPAPLFAEGEFTFESFHLAFTGNAITGASVRGTLDPPFFDVKEGSLGLELALQQDGRVRAALTSREELHLGVRDFFDIAVSGIDVELQESDYRLRLDGHLTLDFLDTLSDELGGANEAIGVDLERLNVLSTGEVSIDGGWVRFPQPKKFQLFGFEVTLKGVGFGSDEDEIWMNLDAELALTEVLPLGGSVEGFRVVWGKDGAYRRIDFSGIEVDFRQPGAVSFHGSVSWGGGSSFAGRVTLALEAIHLTVDAVLSVGRLEGARYFYIQLFSEFPAGVPIFSGLSLYGLGGLFASNLAPNVDAFCRPLLWYAEHDDWDGTVEPCAPVDLPFCGDPGGPGAPTPWCPVHGALAFGAGALIGTSDDGYAAHAKAFLLVSLPGPVVSFQAKANILKERGSLSRGAEPIFNAYLLLTDDFVEMGVGVNYDLESVLKIEGDAEAFFNLADASDWHVYLGQVEMGREIQATVVSFLRAKAFFMIHPARADLDDDARFGLGDVEIPTPDLAFGAGIGFDEEYSAGPLGIALRALIDGWAAISVNPIHFGGGMGLDGSVDLYAFGFSIGLGVGADLTFRTPAPYLIRGEFDVSMRLPWPLPDPEATVVLEWKDPEDPDPVFPVLKDVNLTARDGSGGQEARVQSADSLAAADWRDGDGNLTVPLAPLDHVPNVTFLRLMNDYSGEGFLSGAARPDAVADGSLDAADSVSGSRFSYRVSAVELSAAPFAGVGAAHAAGSFDAAPSGPGGVWMPEPRRLADGELEAYPSRQLVLYDENPFSHMAASDFAIEPCEGEGCGEGAGGGAAAAVRMGLAEWLVASGACVPPCQEFLPTPGAHETECRCPQSGGGIEDPCQLADYSVFRVRIETEVVDLAGNVEEPEPEVKYAYFYTQGPPLDLAPYVHEVVPSQPARPYFRGYDVAVRFNQGHLRQLYRRPPPRGDIVGRGVVVCDADPGLGARILDGGRNVLPVDAFFFGPHYSKALDHVEPVHDGGDVKSPRDVFEELGGSVVLDDILNVPLTDVNGLRPGERHILQVYWSDHRLADDTRACAGLETRGCLTPEEKAAGEKIIFELPFLASRFRDLDDLLETFEDPGAPAVIGDCEDGHHGRFFALPLEVTAGSEGWDEAMRILRELHDFKMLHEADGLAPFASRLRDAHPTEAPGAADEKTLRVWMGRVERLVECFDLGTAVPDSYAELGCAAWGPEPDGALSAIRDGWELERAAFDQLDRRGGLGLERFRQPLPEVVELSVLHRDSAAGREWLGFLLELPEPLDWGRVSKLEAFLDGVGQDLVVVKNEAGSRVLLVSFEPGAGPEDGDLLALGEGDWKIELSYQDSFPGWTEPPIVFGAGRESADVTSALCFHLGADLFPTE